MNEHPRPDQEQQDEPISDDEQQDPESDSASDED
jgi:hypothetical protein